MHACLEAGQRLSDASFAVTVFCIQSVGLPLVTNHGHVLRNSAYPRPAKASAFSRSYQSWACCCLAGSTTMSATGGILCVSVIGARRAQPAFASWASCWQWMHGVCHPACIHRAPHPCAEAKNVLAADTTSDLSFYVRLRLGQSEVGWHLLPLARRGELAAAHAAALLTCAHCRSRPIPVRTTSRPSS